MMRAQCQFLARQAETNSQRQAEKPISAARQIRFQSKMSFITDGMLRFFHRTPPRNLLIFHSFWHALLLFPGMEMCLFRPSYTEMAIFACINIFVYYLKHELSN